MEQYKVYNVKVNINEEYETWFQFIEPNEERINGLEDRFCFVKVQEIEVQEELPNEKEHKVISDILHSRNTGAIRRKALDLEVKGVFRNDNE